MTRQDYFSLYDAIHTLVRQEEITKDQENTLYDLIGRQDRRLASAYQVRASFPLLLCLPGSHSAVDPFTHDEEAP